MKAQATFETKRAARYLTALCHHFGRKVETECTGKSGWAQFPTGRCDFAADDERLAITASADNQADLDRLMTIVSSHLERFAFRENPDLVWRMAVG